MAGYAPITYEDIMKNLTEVQKRQIRAKKLRAQEEEFKAMKTAEGTGHYTKTQQGGLFPTIAKYQKDYGAIGNAITGSLGEYLTGRKANKEEEELNAIRNPQIIGAVQQMSQEKEPIVPPAVEQAAVAAAPPPVAPPVVPPVAPSTVDASEVVDLTPEGQQRIEALGAKLKVSGLPPEEIDRQMEAAMREEMRNGTSAPGAPPSMAPPVGPGAAALTASLGVPPPGPLGGPPPPRSMGGPPDESAGPPAPPPPVPPVMPPPAPTGAADLTNALGVVPPGAGPVPTDQTLRAYLSMLGGPEMKDITGPRRLIKTEKLDSGEIVNVYSDGEREKTGEFGDFNARTMVDKATGNVYTTGSSGAGRGKMTLVTDAQGNPVTMTPAAAEAAGIKTAEITAKAEAEATTAPLAAQTAATIKGAEKEAELTTENRVAAQASLPKAKAAATSARTTADNLLASPGLKGMISSSLGGRMPEGKVADLYFGTVRAGTPEADAYALHNQLTSKAFLDSYADALKGTGPISNIEGLKAIQSKLRNARSQSEDSYRAALTEFVETLQATADRVQAAAASKEGVANRPALPSGWTYEE